MALDIDQLPINDRVIQFTTGRLTHNWSNLMTSIVQTISETISQNGIFVPKLTTAQRDALKNVPDGQVIYNTTLNKFQGREAGAWVNFV